MTMACPFLYSRAGLKGGIAVFFRVVSLKYRDKSYQYLRLMQNRREGRKVRQVELLNLRNLSRFPAEKNALLLQELKKLNAVCNSLYRHVGGIARAAFLTALERAFQPPKLCPAGFLSGLLNERRAGGSFEGELFSLIKDYADSAGGSYVCLINRSGRGGGDPWAGYLMNESGLLQRYWLWRGSGVDAGQLAALLEELKSDYQVEKMLFLVPVEFTLGSAPYREPYASGRVVAGLPFEWLGLCVIGGDFYAVMGDIWCRRDDFWQHFISRAATALIEYRWLYERMVNIAGDALKDADIPAMFVIMQFFLGSLRFYTEPVGAAKNQEINIFWNPASG
jgi:hypothetical protein